jgi:hypothetical protein
MLTVKGRGGFAGPGLRRRLSMPTIKGRGGFAGPGV